MNGQETKPPFEGESLREFGAEAPYQGPAGAQPAPPAQPPGDQESNGQPDEAAAAAAAYEATKLEQMILQLPTCPVCQEAPARVNDIMTTHPNGHRFLTVFCGNPGCRAILSVQFLGVVRKAPEARQVEPVSQMPPPGAGPRFRGRG